MGDAAKEYRIFTGCVFFSSRGRDTRWPRDWSSDVCSSDLARLERLFNHLCGGRTLSSQIEIENRMLQSKGRGHEVVWFDFATLCETARSQNDYLDLAQRFKRSEERRVVRERTSGSGVDDAP